eukprot:TRINITY_DN1024_c0_g1_i3.p1 TRINITY_DN1024_c0_g1~~TRINITY_DN1024_c0_g1_i3.p1  ORF type:complete len:312 (-),score=43.72 TRINITY_DN1024_c0_g1_i3:45-980(-)
MSSSTPRGTNQTYCSSSGCAFCNTPTQSRKQQKHMFCFRGVAQSSRHFTSKRNMYNWSSFISLTSAHVIDGCPLKGGALSDRLVRVEKLLAPLAQPPNIICIGLNYKKHASETGMAVPSHPIVFYKNSATIQNPGDPIVIPSIASSPPEVDYEAELVVVIGKACKNATKENALDFVAGYTVANDVSARRWQGNVRGGSQWCFAKSFDTFCPIGPVVVGKDIIPDPNQLGLSCTLNGTTMQSSSTSDMIFDVPTIIAFLSQGTTLLPGTIILTGTPEGVGFTRQPPVFLTPGDNVSVSVEKIGCLNNPVVSE